MKTQRWTGIPIPAAKQPGKVAWSPDGETVYVYVDHVILRCRLRMRHADLLAELPKSPTSLWWGDWFGVSPDGKVIVTRQTGAGDIYALAVQKN